MRKLYLIPIIHTKEDLGTIGPILEKRGIKELGKFWQRHKETIKKFWDSIFNFFNSFEKMDDFKIYQDGMIADGEMGRRIVEEGVRGKSKNYEIIEDLLEKGAILVKTEDLSLVKKEYEHLIRLTKSKNLTEKLNAYLRYKLAKNRLLQKRDRFIAHQIEETLKDGETGILFLGAYHNIIPELSSDIKVNQLKRIEKIKEYQRLLSYYPKSKEQIEELSQYLISPIT